MLNDISNVIDNEAHEDDDEHTQKAKELANKLYKNVKATIADFLNENPMM